MKRIVRHLVFAFLITSGAQCSPELGKLQAEANMPRQSRVQRMRTRASQLYRRFRSLKRSQQALIATAAALLAGGIGVGGKMGVDAHKARVRKRDLRKIRKGRAAQTFAAYKAEPPKPMLKQQYEQKGERLKEALEEISARIEHFESLNDTQEIDKHSARMLELISRKFPTRNRVRAKLNEYVKRMAAQRVDDVMGWQPVVQPGIGGTLPARPSIPELSRGMFSTLTQEEIERIEKGMGSYDE